MTTEQIIQIVIGVFPSLTAIVTMIGVIAKTISAFTKLKKQVTDMKDISELKVQMKQVLQENYELKKTLNETMTKIDHIERK